MLKRLAGLAAAAVLASAGAAFAAEEQKEQRAQEGIGGAEQLGMEQQEIVGEVVSVDRQTLYLEHMGAVIPLKLQRETEFEQPLTRRDLREGQQVRASFKIENRTNNVAMKIAPAQEQMKMQPEGEPTF